MTDTFAMQFYTARTKTVLDIAADEAAKLGQNWIGTEHLLVAMLLVDDGPAAVALKSMGVTLERGREALATALLPPEAAKE
jgi:ATP-dependent Clp protease ATP-binding subunit ClpC